MKIYDPSAPEYLYKYQGINKYSVENLQNSILWASHPSDFNDPFEFKFQRLGKNMIQNEIDQLIDEIEKCKVLCFTLNPLNILMWSHYANFHKGMCLQFKNETLTYEVNYSDSFPLVDFENQDPNQRKIDIVNILHTKAKIWEYEKERRMSFFPGSKSEVNYPGKLENIIFGVNTSNADIDRVKKVINQDVNLYKCDFIDGNYEIEFKKIAN